jgi:hypothetical protein
MHQFSSIILRVGRGISQGDSENGGSASFSRSTNKELSIRVTSESSTRFSRDIRHWVHPLGPHPPLPLHYHSQTTTGPQEKEIPIVNIDAKYNEPAQTPALKTESACSVDRVPTAEIHVV